MQVITAMATLSIQNLTLYSDFKLLKNICIAQPDQAKQSYQLRFNWFVNNPTANFFTFL